MNIKAINKWIPNLKRPLVIAGPCSAETEEQVMTTAKELVQNVLDGKSEIILGKSLFRPAQSASISGLFA